MSDYFEVEERLREALSYRRAHPKPLYNFYLGSSRWIRIAFIISPKVKILAIPVLLPIKSLIKIKILHYAGISKASIPSAYLFVTKQLSKLPTRTGEWAWGWESSFYTMKVTTKSQSNSIASWSHSRYAPSFSYTLRYTGRQNHANMATFKQSILASNILQIQLTNYMWDSYITKTENDN